MQYYIKSRMLPFQINEAQSSKTLIPYRLVKYKFQNEQKLIELKHIWNYNRPSLHTLLIPMSATT
jgi:hypothetical protein